MVKCMKTIKIKSCNKCPYFSYFPADYFEGDCNAKNNDPKQDTRITDRDSIPCWCPLT